MTASEAAKQAGLESLAQVSRIAMQSTQTLNNWYKHKPELFKVVLAGCAEAFRAEVLMSCSIKHTDVFNSEMSKLQNE